MKLRKIHVSYLPGIDERFSVSRFGDGFNVIHGPNGIGKSSLSRLVRSMLWPSSDGLGGVRAHAFWDIDGQTWRVDASGKVKWSCDGQPAAPPASPPEALADCFAVGMRSLLDADGASDRQLADQVRTAMAGGVDFRKLESDPSKYIQSIKDSYNVPAIL